MEQLHTGMVDAVNGGPARRIRRVWIMSRSPEKPERRNGDRRTRNARPRGLPASSPAEHPQYAFAALYEGDVGSKVHGGQPPRR